MRAAVELAWNSGVVERSWAVATFGNASAAASHRNAGKKEQGSDIDRTRFEPSRLSTAVETVLGRDRLTRGTGFEAHVGGGK